MPLAPLTDTRPLRVLTPWRLTLGRHELLCRMLAYPDGEVSLVVTDDGRPLERVVCYSDDEGWSAAVALHERHGRRVRDWLAGETPDMASPAREPVRSVDQKDLRRRLRSAVQRLERARVAVIRLLEQPDVTSLQAVATIREFRSAWEVLDLEYHLLSGASLSADAYRALRDQGRLTVGA